jgi:hypothetical protein
MSYFWMAMTSGRPVSAARFNEARRLAAPVAAGSPGLSGKRSNRRRPMTVSARVFVAWWRAWLAATIT